VDSDSLNYPRKLLIQINIRNTIKNRKYFWFYKRKQRFWKRGGEGEERVDSQKWIQEQPAEQRAIRHISEHLSFFTPPEQNTAPDYCVGNLSPAMGTK
jgi:hypothetical protein